MCMYARDLCTETYKDIELDGHETLYEIKKIVANIFGFHMNMFVLSIESSKELILMEGDTIEVYPHEENIAMKYMEHRLCSMEKPYKFLVDCFY